MIELKTHPKEYAKIHKWLKANLYQSIECDKKSKDFHWAKKIECHHDYDRNNYLMLCHKCHAKYDANEKGRKRSHTIKFNQDERINIIKDMVKTKDNMVIKKYCTVKDMPKYYPFFSEGSLRHIIHENRNGVKECIVRVGRRLFFDLEKFQRWMDKQNIGG
jgi:hypothetical protein